jgi:hypothetical protein
MAEVTGLDANSVAAQLTANTEAVYGVWNG